MSGIIEQMGSQARLAASEIAGASTGQRDRALLAMAAAVRDHADRILSANREDLAGARERGLSGAVVERLRLNADRVSGIALSVEQVAALPDPVGRELAVWARPNGLRIRRISVPIGVIGVIYESRPNVTADAAVLCLKAGNSVILRGGSEAVASNRALHQALSEGLTSSTLPAGAMQMVPDQDRALVGQLLGAVGLVDVIVPRGGRSLVARVQADARVPVFAHLDGNNHLYIHTGADPAMAANVVVNAKMRRPGICGALETILVDRQRLDLVPELTAALVKAGCEVRGDATVQALDNQILPASEADWDTEYLDAIVAMAAVDDMDSAIAHIRRHGSAHTDGIITDDETAAARFLAQVDSAIVVHNASTQFADGGEFGFGAEIGIATGRLHARGPVGLEQLTTFKYQVLGSGQTRPAA